MGLCHLLQSASVVEPLSAGRRLQVPQSDLVDVVMGMGDPERFLFRKPVNLISCPYTRSPSDVRVDKEKRGGYAHDEGIVVTDLNNPEKD